MCADALDSGRKYSVCGLKGCRVVGLWVRFENPLYYDLDKGQPVAPLTYVFSVNHDSLAELDVLGRPTYAFSPPPAHGLVLRAGNEYRFSRPVRVGDLIRTRRRGTV